MPSLQKDSPCRSEPFKRGRVGKAARGRSLVIFLGGKSKGGEQCHWVRMKEARPSARKPDDEGSRVDSAAALSTNRHYKREKEKKTN